MISSSFVEVTAIDEAGIFSTGASVAISSGSATLTSSQHIGVTAESHVRVGSEAISVAASSVAEFTGAAVELSGANINAAAGLLSLRSGSAAVTAVILRQLLVHEFNFCIDVVILVQL